MVTNGHNVNNMYNNRIMGYNMGHPKAVMLQINKKRYQYKFNVRTKKASLRKQVLKKYNYTCQMCLEPYPEYQLENDHIIPLQLNGEDSINNCQCLCLDCHVIKTQKEINP